MCQPEMRFGAVAIIDALGWKGIWKRTDNVQAILDRLRNLEQKFTPKIIQELAGRFFRDDRLSVEITPRFLSDTIFLGISLSLNTNSSVPEEQRPEIENKLRALALVDIAAIVAELQLEAVIEEPVLVYRGCHPPQPGNRSLNDR